MKGMVGGDGGDDWGGGGGWLRRMSGVGGEPG
jgi:hypothetical protein